MVSKIELQHELGERETQIEDLQDLLEEANQRAARLAAENDAHRERERLQMQTQRNAEQAKLRAAEREARRESINRLGKGLIQLDARSEVRFEYEASSTAPAKYVATARVELGPDEAKALEYFVQPKRFILGCDLAAPCQPSLVFSGHWVL